MKKQIEERNKGRTRKESWWKTEEMAERIASLVLPFPSTSGNEGDRALNLLCFDRLRIIRTLLWHSSPEEELRCGRKKGDKKVSRRQPRLFLASVPRGISSLIEEEE